jgi:tetrapyrrole methylase family protein/MazG family protein
MDSLYDELGDVMLQIVFHAKIAQQSGEFDISDVTTAICEKMISRHSHIFGSATAHTPGDVIKNWEIIKKQEKNHDTQTDVLKSVPKSMPALLRSGKVQHKAAHIGFDFEQAEQAIEKLREEIVEIEHDIKAGRDLAEECGDLLFSAVNVVRLLGIDPEITLQNATDKFIRRFEYVEKLAIEKNIDMKKSSLEELDALWNEAKKAAD